LRLLIRWLRRFAVLGLGIVGVWFIVFVLRITDRRLPTILALSLTYAIAAYVILPRVVRMGLKILQRMFRSQLRIWRAPLFPSR
jgi:hypothetical protein